METVPQPDQTSGDEEVFQASPGYTSIHDEVLRSPDYVGRPGERDPFADFRNFVYVVWKHLKLPDPTPAQYDIAYRLQHGDRRQIIEAFRGIGKSWITAAFVCWLLYRCPQIEILVVSASKNRADDFTTFVLALIEEMPLLAHLIPGTKQRQSKVAFDVGPKRPAQSPSVKSLGITSQLSGGRADWIVGDDIEVPNNSATQGMRQQLAERVKEFDAILKPNGHVDYLGTPQTEQSVYNELAKRGYSIYVLPARYPSDKEMKAYGDRLAPYVLSGRSPATIGRTTDPMRFTDKDLIEREGSYGRSGFALQFMLDTTLSDENRYPLKLRDLILFPVDPDRAPSALSWASDPSNAISDIPNAGFNGDGFYRPMWFDRENVFPYSGTVMSIDPSGRGKDELGYCVTKFLHGMIFVVAAGGLVGGYDDATLEQLAQLALKHSVNKIIVEANFGDGMFSKLFIPVLHKVHRCAVEDVKHSKQKELRIIDTLEPVMNRHKLIFDPQVFIDDIKSAQERGGDKWRDYMLAYQLTHITKDRGALIHDDRLDALAIAVAHWTEVMSRDTEKAADQAKTKAIEGEIKDFIKKAKNGKGTFVNGTPKVDAKGSALTGKKPRRSLFTRRVTFNHHR